MSFTPRFILPLIIFTVAFAPVFAQSDSGSKAEKKQPSQEIGIGSPAPALAISQWVKGTPVRSFQKGHVYVIDCWATWCGPCIKAIPHMTEIQDEYKDKVTVIGVSMWERKPSGVAPFVKGQGDDMNYTVAMDRVPAWPAGVKEDTREAGSHAYNEGEMSQTWMKAAQRGGIPTVFIVDQSSRVAWIGHPMGGMDDALSQIVDGSYDIEKAARKYQEDMRNQKITREFSNLLRAKQHDKAFELARTHMEKLWFENSNMLNSIAWTIVDPENPIENPDLELAMKAAVQANKLTKNQNAAIMDTLARVYFVDGQITRAIELQEQAVKAANEQMAPGIEKALEEYRKAAKGRKYF